MNALATISVTYNPPGACSEGNDAFTITQSGNYIFKGNGSTVGSKKIVVNSSLSNVTITLDSVSIRSTNSAAFSVGAETKVTLTLKSKNELHGGSKFAGLRVHPTSTLIIEGGNDDRLSAEGTGGGAGIGGNINEQSGTITINGGYVTATVPVIAGSNGGAGIGGGEGGSGGATITGGIIIARSNGGGAGIGGGRNGNAGKVTITGGKVTATSRSRAAGIGGGDYGTGEVTINGGEVDATGGDEGAGIGGGAGSNGIVYIDSGKVTATGGKNGAAGIGGGAGRGGKVTINGGEVTATSFDQGAGIGGGYSGKGEVTITGGKVTANATNIFSYSSGGAGIGGGDSRDGNVTITGGKVDATGGNLGAGIGGGSYGKGEVTITGGEVNATGGDNGAGIGGGTSDTGKVNIKGGKVTAFGGSNGAGIGGGNSGKGEVTINGGEVTATGGNLGAGIGGGDYGTGEVAINGGEVAATGGDKGAGIGGGEGGAGKVYIDSGKVAATGGNNGAGIGGGIDGAGEVAITGGEVAAIGSSDGAGIGGGKGGDGKVNIKGGKITAKGLGGGAGIGGGADGAGIDTISGGTVFAKSVYGKDIGGGENSSLLLSKVIIDGGSVQVGSLPVDIHPSNSAGYAVYLTELTLRRGSSVVDMVKEGRIGGQPCAKEANAFQKIYGINDVWTDNAGKLYFWLPKTGSSEVISITTAAKATYDNSFTRSDDNSNRDTLYESPATVTSVTPSSPPPPGETYVNPFGVIQVTFSRPMRTGIYPEDTVMLLCSGCNEQEVLLQLQGGRAWKNSAYPCVLTIPFSGLEYTSAYRVLVKGFRDTVLNLVVENSDYVFHTRMIGKVSLTKDDLQLKSDGAAIYDGREHGVEVSPNPGFPCRASSCIDIRVDKIIYIYEDDEGNRVESVESPPRNAGSYEVWVKIDGGTNYRDTTIEIGTLVIDKATITKGDLLFEGFDGGHYDGYEHVVEVSQSPSFPPCQGPFCAAFDDIIKITYRKDGEGNPVAPVVNAGEYTITVTVDNPNYKGDEFTLDEDFVIKKATITEDDLLFEGFDGGQYDGQEHNIVVLPSPSFPCQGPFCADLYDVIKITYDRKDDKGNPVASAVDAGEYTVTVTVDNPNYEDAEFTLAEDFVIEKANLTDKILWYGPKKVTYGGPDRGVVVTPAPGVSGIVIIEIIYIDADGREVKKPEEPVEKGTYTVKVKVEVDDATNFVETVAELELGPFQVVPATYLYDTICQGEAYAKDGFSLPAQSESVMDSITLRGVDYDSIVWLHLTVNEQIRLSNVSRLVTSCDDNPAVEYEVVSGNPTHYSIAFSGATQRFLADVEGAPLPAGFAAIPIHIPSDASHDDYNATITLSDNACYSEEQTFTFTLRYPTEAIMSQKWDDVVALYRNNRWGYEFVGYQWLKDGEEIPGAVQPYLYVSPTFDFSASYSVRLTRSDDGVEQFTCPFRPHRQDVESNVTTYPTIVASGGHITVAAAQHGEAVIRNIQGAVTGRQKFAAGASSLAAPREKGVYLVELRAADGKVKMVKIVVK
jgi:hypothetical protein